jgi:hypothetical protein
LVTVGTDRVEVERRLRAGDLACPCGGVLAPKSQGQLSVEQLVDRYPIACRPVRDLLVDYLRGRQPVLDHATLRSLARTLASLFWRDLETITVASTR